MGRYIPLRQDRSKLLLKVCQGFCVFVTVGGLFGQMAKGFTRPPECQQAHRHHVTLELVNDFPELLHVDASTGVGRVHAASTGVGRVHAGTMVHLEGFVVFGGNVLFDVVQVILVAFHQNVFQMDVHRGLEGLDERGGVIDGFRDKAGTQLPVMVHVRRAVVGRPDEALAFEPTPHQLLDQVGAVDAGVDSGRVVEVLVNNAHIHTIGMVENRLGKVLDFVQGGPMDKRLC